MKEHNEGESITDGSTFKPKSLKNQSRSINNIKPEGNEEPSVSIQAKNLKRALVNVNNHDDDGQDTVAEMFTVKLKPLKTSGGPSLGHWASRKARKKSNDKPSEQ